MKEINCHIIDVVKFFVENEKKNHNKSKEQNIIEINCFVYTSLCYKTLKKKNKT